MVLVGVASSRIGIRTLRFWRIIIMRWYSLCWGWQNNVPWALFHTRCSNWTILRYYKMMKEYRTRYLPPPHHRKVTKYLTFFLIIVSGHRNCAPTKIKMILPNTVSMATLPTGMYSILSLLVGACPILSPSVQYQFNLTI